MKGLLVAQFLFCLIFGAANAQINNFPYTEDFENGPGLFSTYGTNSSWEWGVPNNSFISSAASGQNAWVTNLSGNYNGDEASYLESPYFDFSAQTGTMFLSFSHIYEIESTYDYSHVEYTIDSGQTWSSLGVSGAGINWYSTSYNDWDGNSGPSGEWRNAIYPLNVLNGEASLAFRFVLITDYSRNYEGVGVDDFSIVPDLVNISVNKLISPVTGCGLATDTVKVELISNIGVLDSAFTLCYKLDGVEFCESFSDTITESNPVTVSFSNTVDLSQIREYSFEVYLKGVDNVMLTSKVKNLPLISAQDLPYSEDFETGSGAWYTSGTNSSWEWGMPNFTFIDKAASGQKAWVTGLSSSYNPDEFSFLNSPCFDFSNLSGNPTLFFSLIYNTEAAYDQTWLEYSTDAGLNWQKLGSAGNGLNWYNNSNDEVWDGEDETPGVWCSAYYSLADLVGSPNARLRFVLNADNGYQYDGIGIDDIQIVVNPKDLLISDLLSPKSECGLSDTEFVQVQLDYPLGDTLYGISLCYELNGNAVCESFPDTIYPNDTKIFTFQTKANLASPAQYNFKVYHTELGDAITNNDTLALQIMHKAIVSSLPYLADFESGPSYFSSYGINSSWEYGIPTNISSSAPNSKVWGTNLSGNYKDNETSYLESNCFDFSSLNEEPIVSFSLNYDTESCCDKAWLEFSSDGGSTWNKVLAGLGSENWYNNTGSQQWNGSSGGWLNSKTRMNAAMGASNVKFRFAFDSDASSAAAGFYIDNFLVYTSLTDLQVTEVLLPESSCGLSNAEAVSGIVKNNGTDFIYGFEACYQLNNGTASCQQFNDTLAPNMADTILFSNHIDLSNLGTYTLKIFTHLQNDFSIANDSASASTTNKRNISSFPFVEDFENGDGSWESFGAINSWAFGTPQKNVIQGAASGQNAWTTNLTGDYHELEFSHVLSPCFDFSAEQAGLWVGMHIWWDTELNWDGAALQYSIDSQATWNSVGEFMDPYNWYNNNNFLLSPGGNYYSWSGQGSSGSGSYVWAQSKLDSAIFGQEQVLFRVAFESNSAAQFDGFAFDDFSIGEIPNPKILSDTVVCSGAIARTDIVGASYLWSNGSTDSQIYLENTGTTAIYDTISVEVKNTYGFVGRDTLIVKINPGPYFDLGNELNLCADQCISIGADLDNFDFNWNTGANTDSITVCSSNPGIYILSASYASSACSFADTVNIQFSSPVDLGTNLSFCFGDTLSFSQVPSIWDSIQWSTGSTSPSIVLNTGGNIWVRATDSLGCTSSDTIFASVNPLPQIMDLGTDTVICDTAQLILNAGNAADIQSYTWTLNNQVIANSAEITVSESGIYFVEVFTNSGCSSKASKTVSIEVCSGIDRFLAENSMQVYPNPSSSNIFVEIDGAARGKIQISIFDLSGKELLNTSLEKNASLFRKELDLKNWSKGLYFLSIQHENTVLKEKIILQ